MLKAVSFRYQQCLGPFMILLSEGSSETGLFRQSRLSESVISETHQLEGSSFFENVQNFDEISNVEKEIL